MWWVHLLSSLDILLTSCCHDCITSASSSFHFQTTLDSCILLGGVIIGTFHHCLSLLGLLSTTKDAWCNRAKELYLLTYNKYNCVPCFTDHVLTSIIWEDSVFLQLLWLFIKRSAYRDAKLQVTFKPHAKRLPVLPLTCALSFKSQASCYIQCVLS